MNPSRLLLKLSNKIDLRKGKRGVAFSNLSIYYTWRNIKSLYKNNKFKISVSKWNNKFELPNASCSILHIQDYFQNIIKIHETLTSYPPIKIYINKT